MRRAARRLPAAALVAASALLSAAAAPETPPARQDDRARLHIEGAVTGPIVETPGAMQVTTTIQCFCGTCVNQTLHECTCGLAARERARVAASLEAGRTPEQIIAAYVAEHGPQVRIVPERRGLDLVGWSIPFVAALAGLAALSLVLRSWQRRGALHPAPAAAAADGVYRDRLARDLKELDG